MKEPAYASRTTARNLAGPATSREITAVQLALCDDLYGPPDLDLDDEGRLVFVADIDALPSDDGARWVAA